MIFNEVNDSLMYRFGGGNSLDRYVFAFCVDKIVLTSRCHINILYYGIEHQNLAGIIRGIFIKRLRKYF